MITSLTNPAANTQARIKTVELKNIGKKYPLRKAFNPYSKEDGDFWVLKDVSLEVCKGEVLGIIGRNGAGKTTLLNIIAGTLCPTEGEVSLQGKVLGLFNLGVGFQEELTGRENIYLNGAIIGAKAKELNEKLSSIIEFSELGDFINMPLGTYSQGMRLRLAFSIVVNLEFDILVIDEVLAVGDALFQNKCFERLMDLRRKSKTFIITTQSMDMIERLCDKAALLDHGRLLFYGEPPEAVNKYRTLLNTEKFFVGPDPKNLKFIENTKKWADDISDWGKRLGTKEAVIESVEFINKFGRHCDSIKSREPLKVNVRFKTKNKIKEPHFGVAIFRQDGVYCYGPNTAFDGLTIPEINPTGGFFTLSYTGVLLAPGKYWFSVAIWDKNEVLAYDYHNGFYQLTITGKRDNLENELLGIPFNFRGNIFRHFDFLSQDRHSLQLSLLKDVWGHCIETDGIILGPVKLLNSYAEAKDTFVTNEELKIVVNFNRLITTNKNSFLWVGLYRDDGVYCQGTVRPLGNKLSFRLYFAKLPLLPGGYKISVGIWDGRLKRFVMCHHGFYPFRVIFNRQDHGTVYLEHNWVWEAE